MKRMICGKCFSEKQNVLVDQMYPVGTGIVTVYNIPATRCNCRLYVSNSVNQEIDEYIKGLSTQNGPMHVSYSKV